MRILIAEDEPEILKPYQIALEARKHQVVTSESGEECLKIYLDETSKSQHDEMTSTDVVRGASNSSSLFSSPFDVVILDYRLPKKNGMEVAREILETNPDQRIIFASAYVKDTLEDSVRQLKKVVELLQKPFEPDVLVETVEDLAVYAELKRLMEYTKQINKESEPSSEQIRILFEGLRKIQKSRTF